MLEDYTRPSDTISAYPGASSIFLRCFAPGPAVRPHIHLNEKIRVQNISSLSHLRVWSISFWIDEQCVKSILTRVSRAIVGDYFQVRINTHLGSSNSFQQQDCVCNIYKGNQSLLVFIFSRDLLKVGKHRTRLITRLIKFHPCVFITGKCLFSSLCFVYTLAYTLHICCWYWLRFSFSVNSPTGLLRREESGFTLH